MTAARPETFVLNQDSTFALIRLKVDSIRPSARSLATSSANAQGMPVQRDFFFDGCECEPKRASSNSTSSLEPT
jgi:hypothetical protein